MFFSWDWRDGPVNQDEDQKQGGGGGGGGAQAQGAREEAAWVPEMTTVGRLLDVLASRARLKHKPLPGSRADDAMNLALFISGAGREEEWKRLEPSEMIGKVVGQGAKIRLARGGGVGQGR